MQQKKNKESEVWDLNNKPSLDQSKINHQDIDISTNASKERIVNIKKVENIKNEPPSYFQFRIGSNLKFFGSYCDQLYELGDNQ